MLPNGEADCFANISLQCRLGEQSSNETCQHVAAAALSQMRVAGWVHKNFSRLPANERLISFQHHPAVAKAFRDFPQCLRPVCLHFLRVVFNNRAASPGCGVTTRIAVFGEACGGRSQSSALASTIIGSFESRHSCRVKVFISSAISGAANPGPIKIALADSGNFSSGFQILTITACNCSATGR